MDVEQLDAYMQRTAAGKALEGLLRELLLRQPDDPVEDCIRLLQDDSFWARATAEGEGEGARR